MGDIVLENDPDQHFGSWQESWSSLEVQMDKSEEHVFLSDLQGLLFSAQHKHCTLRRFIAHNQDHEKRLNPKMEYIQTNIHVHLVLVQPYNCGGRS